MVCNQNCALGSMGAWAGATQEAHCAGTDNTTVVIALLKPAGAAAAADATVKGGGKKLKAASHAEARQNGNGRYTLRPKHT